MDSVNRGIKRHETSFLFSLTSRSVLFLFLETCVLLSLYLAGNFQAFSDSTQRFILLITGIAAIALMLLSICGLTESLVYRILTGRRRYWIFAGVFFLSVCFSTFVIVFIRIISWISEGI